MSETQPYPSQSARSIGELIQARGKHYGNKPFLIFPEKSQTVTYEALSQRIVQAANMLASLGITHGDKVALLLPNIPEFVFFYWGSMMLGAVAGPVNTLLKGPEIQYIVDHCEAKVLVTTPGFAEEVNRISGTLPLLKHIIVIEDLIEDAGQAFDFPSVLAYQQSRDTYDMEVLTTTAQPVQPDDEAMIIYTSGTTGKPKGVLLTHHNLLTDAAYIRDWFQLTEDSRLMCVLPLFHVNGEVVTLMTPLVMGGSVVLNRKFSASTFWQYIETYQVQGFSLVPTILSILIAQGATQANLSQLEFGICGAAPLPVEVHKQFEALFNVPIYEGYGLSETTCYSTFNPKDPSKRKIGSIGVAVGNEVAIWDEAGNPVEAGEGGEIVIRGENVMKGYFKRPDATEEAFKGGWFHSGDWGKMDDDGFFYILDRVKDMIIRGGENIYPREIDELLYQHPDVEAAATIGVPDPKYGEEVLSYVVLKPQSKQSTCESDLLDYCQANLANFKCPKHIYFIDEIPKGPTGKLLRRVLREFALSANA